MLKKHSLPVLCLIIAFLAMIMLPNFAFLLPEEENLEQRTLAELPSLSADSLLSFPAAFDTFYNDHLPLKNQLMGLYTSIAWNAFNTSTNPSVIKGKEGWFFFDSVKANDKDTLADYQHSVLYTEDELVQITNHVELMRQACEERGIAFYLLLCPNKSTIYGDLYLPQKYQTKANEQSRTNQLVDYLRANSQANVVWPEQELISARDSGLRVYQKSDTHWNQLGAYVAYQALRAAMGESAEPLPAYTPYVSGAGDLARMLAMRNVSEELFAVSYRPDAEVSVNEQSDPNWQTMTSTAADQQLLIYHDSYMIMMKDYLARSASRCTFTTDFNFNAAVLDKEKPDTVIYEMVERNAPLLNYYSYTAAAQE